MVFGGNDTYFSNMVLGRIVQEMSVKPRKEKLCWTFLLVVCRILHLLDLGCVTSFGRQLKVHMYI